MPERKRPRRGLIVGKFYPPHRGHKDLIDTARVQVDELFVIIGDRPGESPPATLRATWLREIHPDVNVMLIDDRYDETDSRVWADNSVRMLGFRLLSGPLDGRLTQAIVLADSLFASVRPSPSNEV